MTSRRTPAGVAGRCAAATAAAALLLGATAAPLLPAEAADAGAPPACDPRAERALRLVAPDSLPTGFTSGIYLEREGPGYPNGPSRSTSVRTEIRFAPEADGRLRFAYTADERDRDVYYRWPLRFARGDGAGRLSATYTERDPAGAECRRELSRVVRPVAIADPGVRLGRATVSDRVVADATGLASRKVRVRVSGRTRRRAARTVRLDVYEGMLVRAMKRVRVRDRRLAATIRFTGMAGSALGPIRVVAHYPGDVRESWPCDDVFTTGPDDDCTPRRTRPH